MRALFILLSIIALNKVYAQNVQIQTTDGSIYTGNLISDVNDTLCIKTKYENTLCFNRSVVKKVEYINLEIAPPALTKAFNPRYYNVIFGGQLLIRDIVPAFTTSFHAHQRITNHWSAGLYGGFGLGPDLFDLRTGISNEYQFRFDDWVINSVGLRTGIFKETSYGSEDGFEIDLEYSRLFKRVAHLSQRFAVSAGIYSAKWNYSDCYNCEVYNHRFTDLNIKVSYGFQF